MPVLKTCVVCSKEFSVPPCRSESATTCSKACADTVRANSRSKPKVPMSCKHCGKIFEVHQSTAGTRIYCSRKCVESSPEMMMRKSSYKGDKNPAWKGGAVNNSAGYVLLTCSNHPFKVGEYVFEHRLVVEYRMRNEAPDHHFMIDVEGVKYLRREIDVHHKNEIKNDNRPENLIACTAEAHHYLHIGMPIMRGTVWPEVGNEIEFSDRKAHFACEFCKKEFTVNASTAKRSNVRFCSINCRNKFYLTNESNLPSFVEKPCDSCGLIFTAKRHKILRGGGKYCSNPCRIIGTKGKTGAKKKIQK